MKIFVFKNKIDNYYSGNYCFIAEDRVAANNMAMDYSRDHNTRANMRQTYVIKWDMEDVKVLEIVPGYIPINKQNY